MTSVAELQAVRARLIEAAQELGPVVCRIPGDEEQGLDLGQGLAWLDDSVAKGLAVDFRVVPDPGGEGGEIWLQHWDPAEPKPPWSEDWEDEDAGLGSTV
jgi:hypothetical protein